MKKYFIELKGNKIGPLTIDDVRSHKISSTTLVWTEGMEDWVMAANLKELGDVIYVPKKEVTPPPLPSESLPSLLLAGVGFLIFNIIMLIAANGNVSANPFLLAVISLIIRIYSSYLAVKKAKVLGKNTFNWGLFTFIFPVLGLLILGFTKKK